MSKLAIACALFAWVPSVAASQAEPNVNWVSGPGVVSLGPKAELKLKAGHAFAGAKDTQELMRVLGNSVSGHEVGMVRPEAQDEDWMLVFDQHDVGYVRDDEKGSIDKNALFRSISEGTEEGNKRRKSLGISPLHVTGWFEEPHYDSTTHNLVWALRAKDEAGSEIVNYNMRILGRSGYMSVTLVDEPARMAASKPVAEEIVRSFDYKAGSKYAEFRAGDKVAEYGLVALIAGGAGAAAVKLGLFAALWKFIAKGGKAIILLIAAGAAAVRRGISALMRRRTEA